jgi:hypothetical protein
MDNSFAVPLHGVKFGSSAGKKVQTTLRSKREVDLNNTVVIWFISTWLKQWEQLEHGGYVGSWELFWLKTMPEKWYRGIVPVYN